MNPNLFARTEARYRRWDETAARNAEIRKRIRRGDDLGVVANDVGLKPYKVKLIAGLWDR